MIKFFHQIKSDKLKLSKTSFFILHLIVPILALLAFVVYLMISKANSNNITIGYLQVISIAFPVVIALLTSILSEQEIEAGDGFFLLSTPSRSGVLFSKTVFLLLGNLFSCLFFGILYGIVTPFFRVDYTIPIETLLSKMLIISACSVFLYGLHLWISLKFGRNINFAVSVIETLFSALLLTGLGEGIWIFFPCAWSVRLSTMMPKGNDAFLQFPKAISCVIIISTVSLFFILLMWFKRWEGRKNEE